MHVSLVQTGIEKISEARPDFDLGDGGPETDVFYAQMQMQPLGMIPEQIRLQGETDASIPGSAPPAALPPGGPKVPTTGAGGGSGTVPSVSGRKYLRDLAGRVGGGQQLEYAVRELLSANPDDEVEIARAYHQMLERTA
jgi:hypothetical protein